MVVIGTGLIGTSVAMAAARHGVTAYLQDRDPDAARLAADLGAGVAAPPPGPVDVAVCAVPPGRIAAVLADAQRRGTARYYTDVGSVKGEAERAVLRTAPDPARYVGGHPMAGRERSGPLAARADLFEGRSWALTPSGVTSPETLECGRELARLCGAVPVVLSSTEHDEAVALTSHLPHVVAALMAARLADAPDTVFRLAGQGLRDVTRVAAGDPALWTDILRANAPAVARVIRDLRADVCRLEAALEAVARSSEDGGPELAGVGDLLARGAGGVARLTIPAAAPAQAPVTSDT
jgi:prephenate dehydrogenase